MGSLADYYIEIKPDLSRFGPALRRDLAAAGPAANAAGMATGKSYSTGIKATAAAAAGAFAAAGVVKGIADSVDKASQFEAGMNQVATQTGETGKGLQELTRLALDMGAKTQFSAQGASDAMLELARGGLTSAQIKGGALASTLTLASAGQLELGDAAGYVVQGLTTFGLKADQAGQVAAALAGGANASTASVSDLGIALSQVGPGAALMGLSIQDTTAALAAFTNNGMQGSDAGTSLKTMLSALQPSTDKAAGALEEMGIITKDGANQFFDATGKIKSMAEVSGILQKGLEGQTQAQKAATLRTIFGSDAYRAAAILAKEGAAGIAGYAKATNDQAAAQDMAAVATKGYKGAMENVQGALETIQIQIGTKFLPILTRALNFVAKEVLPVVSSAIEGAAPRITTGVNQIGAVVGRLWRSFRDGGGVQRVLGQVGDGVGQLSGAIPALVSTGRQLGNVLGFVADHADLIATALPFLVAGFVALKVAQAANTIIGRDSVIGFGLQLAATIALATSNFALAKSQKAVESSTAQATATTNVSTLSRVRQTVATVAGRVASLAAAAAMRTMAVAQRLLNLAMRANPIGIVITVLAALVAGLVVAYRNSETFRRIVDGAFKTVASAGRFMWERVLRPAFRTMVTVWLTTAGTIVRGAATMMGWVPGIGPKMRAAADKFDRFKTDALRALNKVPDVKAVKVTTPGSAAAIRQVDKLRAAMQRVKGAGVPLAVAVGVSNKVAANLDRFIPNNADGGPIHGPGTGRSDSILGLDRSTRTPTAWVSNNEYVVNARSTAKYRPLIEAINADRLADGGTALLRVNTEAAVAKAMKALNQVAQDQGSGGIGGAAGRGSGMGYQRQMAILRGHFPGLQLISGFRKNAITATGNRSYHGMGRAVDIPPRMDLFNWIRANYGRSTKELIFSPAGGRQVWNGKPHMYTGITRANHWDHVHWAMANGGLVRTYDQGGLLRPGTLGYNANGGNERVLTHQQNLLFERFVTAMESGRLSGGKRPVIIQGNVGWDPQDLARAIDRRERDAQTASGLALAMRGI